MEWRCDSRGRVAGLQAWSPEFKPHSHQKKKKTQPANQTKERDEELHWELRGGEMFRMDKKQIRAGGVLSGNWA
jgi:hypothetical protein